MADKLIEAVRTATNQSFRLIILSTPSTAPSRDRKP